MNSGSKTPKNRPPLLRRIMTGASQLADKVQYRTVKVLEKNVGDKPGEVTRKISCDGQWALHKIKSFGIPLHPYDEAFVGEMGFDKSNLSKVMRNDVVDFLIVLKLSHLSFEPVDDENPAVCFLTLAGATKDKDEIIRLIKIGLIRNIADLCLLYEKSFQKDDTNPEAKFESCSPHFAEIIDAYEKKLVPPLRNENERRTMIEVCGRLNKTVVDFLFFNRKKLPRSPEEYSEVVKGYDRWTRRHIDRVFDDLDCIQIIHGLGNFGFTKQQAEHAVKGLDGIKIGQFVMALNNFMHGIRQDKIENRFEVVNLGDLFSDHPDFVEPFIKHNRAISSRYAGQPGRKPLDRYVCIYSPRRLKILLSYLVKHPEDDFAFGKALHELPEFTPRETVANEFIPPNFGVILMEAKTEIPRYLKEAGLGFDGFAPSLQDRFEWSLVTGRGTKNKTGNMTIDEMINQLLFWSTASWECKFRHEYGESIGRSQIFNSSCPFLDINPGCGHPELNGLGKLLFETDIILGGNGQRYFPLLAKIFKNDGDANYDGSTQGRGDNYVPRDRENILAEQRRNAEEVREACRNMHAELSAKFLN